MLPLAAVYDACVLHSAPLRDLLIRLAMTGLVRAKWTDAIHEEWVRSVLERRPDLDAGKLERTRQLMHAAVPDCKVVGYEHLIATLDLPDPDDRHVLAAAIQCGAGVIVTWNLKDFPPNRLEPYGLEAQDPDEFVRELLASDPAAVCAAVQAQRAALRKHQKTVDEHLATLEAQGLRETVTALRAFADRL